MKTKRFPMFSGARATFIAGMSLTVFARAADQTWIDAGPSNNWNTTELNWDAGAGWTQSNSAIFSGAGESVALTEAISAGNLTFSAATGAYTITGNTLTLASGSVIDTGSNNATINSALAGGPIVKSGTGTLQLNAANNFSGTLTVSQGRLQISNSGALNAAANLIIGDVNSTGTPNIYFNNAGTPTFASLTVASGVADARIYTDSWAQNITGTTTLNSALTIFRANAGGVHGGFQNSGKITGPGAGSGNDSLIFDYTGGGGNFYWASNSATANDFGGNLRVKSGVMNAQGGTNAPGNTIIPDTAMVTIDSGATFRWNNFATQNVIETIDGLAGPGTMSKNLPTYTLTINANNSDNEGDRVFTGSLSAMSGTLTLGGSGTQEFSGASPNFTNATTVNNGTLKLTNTSAWGSNITLGASNAPKVQLNAPLTTDSWTFSKSVSGTNTSATVEKTGAGTVILGGSLAFNGTTQVTAGKLLMSSTDAITPTDAAVWLDANDAGTLTLDGSNVNAWANKGSAGGSFTPPGNKPTLSSSDAAFSGKNAVSFSTGSSQCLVNTANYTNTGAQMHSFVVLNRNSSAGNTWRGVLSFGTGTGYDYDKAGAQCFTDSANGSSLTVQRGSGYDMAISNGTTYVTDYSYNGSTMFGYLNGSQTTTAGSSGNFAINRLAVGARWNGTGIAGNYWDGKIAEVLVYNTALSAAQRQGIETYLGRKWVSPTFGISSLNSSGTVTVANAATFGGYGSAGNASVAAGGSIEAGLSGNGALTLANLTFSGASTVSGTPGASAAPLVVTGTLTTGGANSIAVSVPGSLAPGTYHAIQYGSLSGSIGDFKFPAPVRNMTLANNAPNIDVVVSANSAYPIWTGGTNGEWSYAAGSGNWKLSSDSSATDFMSSDNVLFDDPVGLGNTALTVSTENISPGVITFNNSSKNYTLTQSNAKDITTGSLVKSGSGSLTIAGSFTFPGGASLNGGTVSIDSVSSLGTGGRSFDGGTLEYTGATGTIAGTTTINSGGATLRVTEAATVLTQGGSLTTTGTGALTKEGDGAFVLPLAAGTYANPLVVSAGRLDLNYGANATTLSGPISGSGVLSLTGTGANATTGLNLTGTSTLTGETHIYGRRIFLNNPGGNALSGGTIRFMQGHWAYHDLTLNANEQISDTSVLSFETTNAVLYELRINGKTETVGGLACSNGFAIIENAGHDGGNDADNTIGAGTLIVNTANGGDDFSYDGSLRDKNGGTNGALSFAKQGPGTQTLSRDFSYTGTTTVNGGRLVLADPTSTFASPVTLSGGTTLELKRTSGTWTVNPPIGGAGQVAISGFGTVTLAGTSTYTGTTTVQSGTLTVTGTIASPLIDVQFDGTLAGTTVASGQTVQGTGTLSSVTFGTGSTLTPGTASAIDTIVGSGTITFATGSTCAMQVDRTGGVITNDRLANMSAITYGGTLTVTATGQAFANGDVVQLFPNATTYGGSFSGTNLPALTAGLSWDLSGLTSNGSIQVVNTTPTPIFSPPAGGYVGAQTVSISSDTGSTIYYTMDGSPPTISSPHALSPVTGLAVPTNSSVTIKAFAKKSGQGDSPIATSIYNTLDTPVWITDFDGNWEDALNWQGGVVAQGAGVTADFSTLATTWSNTVYLNGPRTVGRLNFADMGDQFGWTIDPGTGGTLLLNNGANPPVVTVNNQTTTISAGITSSSGLRKEGAGTLSLTAANSISGALDIAGGTLSVGNTAAIPNGANVTVGSSGATDPTLILGVPGVFTLGTMTVPSGVTGAGLSMTQNGGTFSHSIGLTTLGSPFTVNQANCVFPNWNQWTWSDRITGAGGGSGNDTLVFNNTSGMQMYFTTAGGVTHDFTGNVHVKAGTIAVQSGAAGSNHVIPDTSMLLIDSTNGGQWRWNGGGFVETIDGLAGAGSMTNPNNVTLTINASNANNHGDRNYSGSLGTMAGILTKAGTGTQTFSGTGITYTNATTIDAGTLELNGTTAFASSAVTVNGGTLLVNNTTGTGTGTTAAITVKSGAAITGAGSVGGTATIEAGGIVAPGNGGIGTLTANNVVFSGTCQIEVGDTTSDQLTVTGTLTTSGTPTIALSTVGTPTENEYTIASYGSVTGTLPAITGVPSGYTVDTATTGVIKLVKTSGYNDWLTNYPGLADTTRGGDPDGDGLTNLQEFLFGTAPNAGTGALTSTENTGGNLVIRWLQRETGATYTLKRNATLAGAWAIVSSPLPAADSDQTGVPTDYDRFKVTLPIGAGKDFFRIEGVEN